MILCSSKNIKVEFDEKNAVLVSLNNGVREFVGVQTPIFEIGLRNADGDLLRVNSSDFTLEKFDSESNGFSCTYKGMHGLKVVINMKISNQIEWNISSEVSSEYVTEWIQYPQITCPDDTRDKGGSGKILWGFNEGVVIDSIDEREKNIGYQEPVYPYVSVTGMFPAIVETQFMAYYNQECGLYFAAHDSEYTLKGVDFLRYKDGVKFQFRHYCGCDFGDSFTLSYPMIMDFFCGDWYVAAEIYRNWFDKNKSNEFIPLHNNNKLPKWYGESPVIITYPVCGIHDMDECVPNKLFPYINVMPHVKRLEKEFGSRIMVLLMHWEGTAPWAPPHVWPPFGGEDELKKLIDALHERGDLLGVYCSGMGWTYQSNLVPEYNTQKVFEEKNLADVMCLSPKQDLPFCNICTGQRSGYDMCPTQSFVKDTLKNEVDQMVNAGIDYIQLMDQNHGGTAHLCYSKSHGHPPVPGKWQVDAMKKLYHEVFANTGKTLFGCESAAAEAYIPYLLFSDNRYVLNYRIGKPVPVYSYIFHEYINNFMGNQVNINFYIDNEKSPDNLLLRTAYAFTSGDMLTAVLNQDGEIVWNWGQLNEYDRKNLPDQDNIKNLVKNLNMWRNGIGKPYLHFGRMKKPYTINCKNNTLVTRENGVKSFENILTSAWEAPDKSFAQFLVNYNTTDMSCDISLPDGNWKVFTALGESRTISSGNNSITIPALSAIMIKSA